jgi:hypothetical protein
VTDTPEPEVMCPEGCGCRLGTEDADARECGCDGPCTGETEPQPEVRHVSDGDFGFGVAGLQ